MEARGWDACDVILVSGDAYVDHPAFGAALVGRYLESLGLRVGIIPQPDTASPAGLSVLGAPRLFWGITAGNIDSQLARHTVMRKPRRTDDYSPDGQAGLRPANATIVYASLARAVCNTVPVVLGGVEASLRRFPFFDFWSNRIRRSVLFDAKGDLLVFGMAESALSDLVARQRRGEPLAGIPGTARTAASVDDMNGVVELPDYAAVSADSEAGRRAFNAMTRLVHIHHRVGGATLVQRCDARWLVVQPPSPPLEPAALDALYALPFTRAPHPVYAGQRIPAFDMIRDSITIHRGCYGQCSFCAIGTHQGRQIVSRSAHSVLEEARRVAAAPGFHGTISDLGGPTANMYGTRCRLGRDGCTHRGCLYPDVCPNLDTSHRALIELMRAVRRVPAIRHAFVTSGIRFDLALAGGGDAYLSELAQHHVCGLLKIAPEHIARGTLRAMRKTGPEDYTDFVRRFLGQMKQAGKRGSVVEYFMSGHPGCTLADMVELAVDLHQRGIRPEQVQDYYPVPMTPAAAMFYTGVDPLTDEPVYVARTDRDKNRQRALLLYHRPEFHEAAREALQAAGRTDLIGRGPGCLVPEGASRRAPSRPPQRPHRSGK
jgi:uncharacterized radical SAM protein YgiQ